MIKIGVNAISHSTPFWGVVTPAHGVERPFTPACSVLPIIRPRQPRRSLVQNWTRSLIASEMEYCSTKFLRYFAINL